MSGKLKYSYEEKILICEDCLNGRRTEPEIAHEYDFYWL